mmetsp:Transcript_3235/g.7515  ORF Transcript_3235/g.7515 Transcript_3235/m.7515 type:complete len:217 (+) Transcript_3235:375-1025(+)
MRIYAAAACGHPTSMALNLIAPLHPREPKQAQTLLVDSQLQKAHGLANIEGDGAPIAGNTQIHLWPNLPKLLMHLQSCGCLQELVHSFLHPKLHGLPKFLLCIVQAVAAGPQKSPVAGWVATELLNGTPRCIGRFQEACQPLLQVFDALIHHEAWQGCLGIRGALAACWRCLPLRHLVAAVALTGIGRYGSGRSLPGSLLPRNLVLARKPLGVLSF